MVAARAGAPAGEGEVPGVGVGDLPGLQEALGVAQNAQDVVALFERQDALDGARLALQLVDPLGLLAALVDGENQTAVHEFLVDVDAGGGEHDGDRALDMVFLGFHASAVRVLAGAGDGEFSLGLQELEGVAGLFGSLFLDDGQDLVFQVGFAEVVEALSGHGGVFDLVFFRKEREDGFHEGGFARRAGGLDDDRQGPGELARGPGEIGGEHVGLLSNDARGTEGFGEFVEQVRRTQQGKRLVLLLRAEFDGGRAVLDRGVEAFFLQAFERHEQFAEIALEQVFFKQGFLGGPVDELAPLAVAVEVEAVDVHEALAGDAQRDAQHFER